MCQESMRGTVMCSRKCCVKTCKGGRQLLVTILICGLGPVRMISSTVGKHCYAYITESQVISPHSLQASVNNNTCKLQICQIALKLPSHAQCARCVVLLLSPKLA